jgi:uncharacterized protein
MKPFCEIIVHMILPGIRALLAKELMETHQLTQEQTATKLGVSQAAVSQYRRELRGSRVKLLQKDKKILEQINNLAAFLINENADSPKILSEVCSICRAVREQKLICPAHKSAMPGLKSCTSCESCQGC